PSKFIRPSFKMLATFFVVFLLGAYGFILFHNAKKDAQIGVAMQIEKQYYELPEVNPPSYISPYMTARSSEKFEEAPIQIIEYADFLCPDCLYLTQQLDRLKEEFAGKINIAFQFFPLDGKCNDVVDKNLHPGACDLSYMAAYGPDKFLQIHDEIFGNFTSARNPEWREELAQKYQVEEALNDEKTKEIVKRIIDTGREYEKTSDRYAYGIRSTPTIILNNRMIIGTLPYEHLRAICQALVEEHEGGKKFIENWVLLRK
ncbi:MAG: thioredoxin domain-containing protein, partial [Candidatus Aminicenantaceae bacterium]